VTACFTLRGTNPASLHRTDIAEDDSLMQRYGVLIPVLREEDSGQELHWPFGRDDILGLL
jgi:hypothetical protein